jgi:hypothetical protein
MQAAEQVYKQIAAHAGTVVEVIAPPEKPKRVKSMFFIDFITIPGNGLGRSICRNFILPGAFGAHARPKAFCIV